MAKPLTWEKETLCQHSKTTNLGKGGTLHACKDTGRLTATQYQAVLNDLEKKSGERYERMVQKPN